MHDLLKAIDSASGAIRFEAIDFTIGEVLNLHRSGELIIEPAFQRAFRWDLMQRSRLVESALLGLPIPQIVLFQRDDGVLELIDGLQRVSSLIHFVDHTLLSNKEGKNRQALVLTGCDLAKDLDGYTYDKLPSTVQLELKRKAIRSVVIRRTNQEFLRYEMFKRLNSGGSPAGYQEVRNAQVRILGTAGVEFLDFLSTCARWPAFRNTTVTLAEAQEERGGLQELVLRFFACKNHLNAYSGSVADWLNDFIESILISKTKNFNYRDERTHFQELFELIYSKFGDGAFVKYRGGKPIGGLAPAYFEAVTMGVLGAKDVAKLLSPQVAKTALAKLVESREFRLVTGPGANSLPKLKKRIELLRTAIQDAQVV